MDRSYLEQNLVAGVYTHHDKYFKKFTENWSENYVNVELIYNVHKGKINQNMERLRHNFIASGKRYWLFMDDDILFTKNDVIEIALQHLIDNDLHLITTYQSNNFDLAKKVDPSNLTFEYICWSAGYFMLVDSEKCGLVPFDLKLPTTHGSLSDITYCMDIIMNDPKDALIGIAPTMIYHADSGYSHKVGDPYKIDSENIDKVNKKVEKYLKSIDPKLMYGDPKIEIVFLSNGDIDENETIGHHYLKHKHPEIYHEIVARPHYNTLHVKDGFTTEIRE